MDLAERPMAEGELRRFVQRFGLEAIMNRDSKRFQELGMRHAQLTSSRWVEKVLSEPELLRLPLVRRLGQPSGLTVGLAEAEWKGWIAP